MLRGSHPAVTEEAHCSQAPEYKHPFREAIWTSPQVYLFVCNSRINVCRGLGSSAGYARHAYCTVMFRGGVMGRDSKLDPSVVETPYASSSAQRADFVILAPEDVLF
jgi:hypothetical protein